MNKGIIWCVSDTPDQIDFEHIFGTYTECVEYAQKNGGKYILMFRDCVFYAGKYTPEKILDSDPITENTFIFEEEEEH